MQGVVIKQAQGLWSIETSSGVRWAGATLESALHKALADNIGNTDAIAATVAVALGALFVRIPDSGGGQIAHGVSGA